MSESGHKERGSCREEHGLMPKMNTCLSLPCDLRLVRSSPPSYSSMRWTGEAENPLSMYTYLFIYLFMYLPIYLSLSLWVFICPLPSLPSLPVLSLSHTLSLSDHIVLCVALKHIVLSKISPFLTAFFALCLLTHHIESLSSSLSHLLSLSDVPYLFSCYRRLQSNVSHHSHSL